MNPTGRVFTGMSSPRNSSDITPSNSEVSFPSIRWWCVFQCVFSRQTGRRGPLRAIAFCLAVGGLVLLFGSSCETVQRTVIVPTEIEGATYAGNKACMECHTNICRVFPMNAHSRVDSDKNLMSGQTGCESCHGPASRHIAAGGGRGKFIVNPRKDPEACFQCHLDVQGQFHLPQRHPVLEGRMNCVQCHDPHGKDIYKPSNGSPGLAMGRLNESCAQCHRDQTRPFVYEHPAMREGCVTCHSPHGSVNPKMLVERDVNLCLKCHVQMAGGGVGPGQVYIGKIEHSAYVRQGTCWSAGCHTAVHGSNMSRLLVY